VRASGSKNNLEAAMTHVSIDPQPEAVKQFFESLALTPEGSVLEMNGRAMVRMLPAEGVLDANRTTEWTPALNERRCDLIGKKFTAGLTPAEEAELATLTAGMRQFIDRVAPVPLEEVRRLHQQLLEKAVDSDSGRAVCRNGGAFGSERGPSGLSGGKDLL
jgi:hypothetical protein